MTVSVTYDPNTRFATVACRNSDGEGRVAVNYVELFQKEHVVPLLPPQGGRPMKRKSIQRRAIKQETKRAEAFGGRRHSGSGSKSGNKSDGSSDRWRMENKFTTAESYRVTLSDLAKLRGECRNAQAPVFNVEFQDKHTGRVRESWVLVPAKEWEKLAHADADNR